jgi:hypothetical protein
MLHLLQPLHSKTLPQKISISQNHPQQPNAATAADTPQTVSITSSSKSFTDQHRHKLFQTVLQASGNSYLHTVNKRIRQRSSGSNASPRINASHSCCGSRQQAASGRRVHFSFQAPAAAPPPPPPDPTFKPQFPITEVTVP